MENNNKRENLLMNSTPITDNVWKQLFIMFYKPQKKLFVQLVFLAIIVAGIEASFSLLTRAVIDEVTAHGVNAQLLPYASLYVVMLLAIVFCVRQFIRVGGRLSSTLMYELRKRCFEHLQSLSFTFYDQHAVGWLVSRITSDCARISRMIAWGILDMFWGVPFILSIFGVLLFLDWQLALFVFAVFPFLVVVSYFFSQKILQSSRYVRRTNSRLTAVYNEGIAGIETSKVLVREQENAKEFSIDTQHMYHLSMNNLLLSSAFFPLVALFISMGTGIALWSGGMNVIGGAMTLGTLVAFITYSRSLIDPLLEIAETLSNLQRTTASAERVLGLLNVEPEIKDSQTVLAMMGFNRTSAENSDNLDKKSLTQKIQDIEFKDITFCYSGSDKPVLKNFNYRCQVGKTIALVGPTGSGKSTIVNLLCRFYEPTHGKVYFNGTDYRELSLNWLQSKLGIVLQTPFLFSGTIRSNIQYGNLNASEEEIIAAAKRVNVHNIIMSMDKGYDAIVEEGGNNLSTGQKQLISFARAIVGDPQILVMDEATSSVDTKTESLLQQGLEAVLKNRTCFIIAHRLSTIRSADKILVIEQGELQEEGSHQELLAKQGKYYSLYKQQFM